MIRRRDETPNVILILVPRSRYQDLGTNIKVSSFLFSTHREFERQSLSWFAQGGTGSCRPPETGGRSGGRQPPSRNQVPTNHQELSTKNQSSRTKDKEAFIKVKYVVSTWTLLVVELNNNFLCISVSNETTFWKFRPIIFCLWGSATFSRRKDFGKGFPDAPDNFFRFTDCH